MMRLSEEIILQVNGLVKSFKNRTVVNHVDFHVHKGEVVVLLGPNGAGKTTSFRMITGLLKPDEGKVFLNGLDVASWPMHRRVKEGKMGYLPQQKSAFQTLTVEQNLYSIMELLGFGRRKRRERCDMLLERFNLTKVRKSRVGNSGSGGISGGECRRLEIARSLITEPEILLLDEPFANVDPVAVEGMQEVINKLSQEGYAVLITDHQVRETLDVTDRCYVIVDGKVLCSGTPADVVANEEAQKKYFTKKTAQEILWKLLHPKNGLTSIPSAEIANYTSLPDNCSSSAFSGVQTAQFSAPPAGSGQNFPFASASDSGQTPNFTPVSDSGQTPNFHTTSDSGQLFNPNNPNNPSNSSNFNKTGTPNHLSSSGNSNNFSPSSQSFGTKQTSNFSQVSSQKPSVSKSSSDMPIHLSEHPLSDRRFPDISIRSDTHSTEHLASMQQQPKSQAEHFASMQQQRSRDSFEQHSTERGLFDPRRKNPSEINNEDDRGYDVSDYNSYMNSDPPVSAQFSQRYARTPIRRSRQDEFLEQNSPFNSNNYSDDYPESYSGGTPFGNTEDQAKTDFPRQFSDNDDSAFINQVAEGQESSQSSSSDEKTSRFDLLRRIFHPRKK